MNLKIRVFKSKLLSILLIIALVLPLIFTTPVLAAGTYPYTTGNTEVSGALNYLRAQQGTDGKISDFSTSAWTVMAIAAAGEDPHNWKIDTNPSIVDYLSANAGSASSATDSSRMILAIVAAGEDPTNFGGIDFLSLLEASYDGTQIGDVSFINDDIWGIMALVAAGKTTTSSTALQGSVAFLLNNQNTDGGWSWGAGQDSDVDDTAAAIMALISAGQSSNSTPITDALAYIKSMQMANGGFESWGETNSATDSWGIAGIAAAGHNPISTAWQSTGGYDPIDDLLSFQNVDGSFNWTAATPSNKALMTSYALIALLGTPYPVAVLSPQPPQQGVTVSVRVEGQNATIWSGMVTVHESTIIDSGGTPHEFTQPTALGALNEAAQVGGFSYVVTDSAYGLYIQSIGGEEPSGLAGWMYRVDYYSPMVGAADFILDQTTPPDPPHGEVLFVYAEWGQAPLRVEVNDTTPGVGDTFTITVTEYDDDTGTWSLVEGATVHADHSYTTGAEGTVAITIDSDLTVEVYAEKDGCIRSNRIDVVVGEGSTQPGDDAEVTMITNIIPAISFSVSPENIDFGDLGPRDISTIQVVTITNEGAWSLLITATVTDTADGLYVDGLEIDSVMWNAFGTTVSRNGTTDCSVTLSVPETYTNTGSQGGTIIFWAAEAP